MRFSWILGSLLILVGCGGSTASVGDGNGDGGGGGDANASDASASDSATDVVTTGDGGQLADSGGTGHGRVPKNNRPQGGHCPSLRGAGMTGMGGPPGSCTKDADCTAGANGRCLLQGFGAARLECSYDACAVDSDCPGNVPCDCRSSDADTAPNLCGAGSTCRVNSDCASCGWCSPTETPNSYCFGRNLTYVCHTASDTCIDDSDCTNATCNFNPSVHHWACVTECLPPPP